MRLYKLYLGLAFLATFYACQTDQPPQQAILNENGAPISPKNFSKIQGNCYQLHSHYLSEALIIEAKDGLIRGEGQGMTLHDEVFYSVSLDGVCADGYCEVSIQRSIEGQANTKQKERWRQQERGWTVESGFALLEIPTHEITYRRIRCAERPDDKYEFEAILGFSEGVGVMRQNGLFGLIDTNYNVLVPPIYAMLSFVSEGTVVFADTIEEHKGKVGIMDINGQTITPPIYINAIPFFEGLAGVMPRNGKGFGFIDRSGKMVIPAKYQQIQGSIDNPLSPSFSDGLAAVAIDSKWGFIDKTGKTIIPLLYEAAQPFINGRAQVVYQGRWITIDKSGNCVANCD